MLLHMNGNDIHAQIQNFFLSLLKREELRHAYCFVGPRYAGKKKMALELSSTILNIPLERLSLHPDFFLIEQEMNEKTGKTKRDIDIDQIKKLREFTSTRPFQAKRKVIVILEAEKMNDHSSNALLKTLEEPKGDTIIFLVTEDENELLPTIRSRAQMIYFYPIDQEKNIKSKEIFSLESQRFLSLFGQPLYQKLKSVEEIFGDKKDHIAAREELQDILNCWEVVNRDKFFQSLQTNPYPKKVFVEVYNRIQEAKKYLHNNIHPKLLVEQILIAIP